jgi:hypothetical protein
VIGVANILFAFVYCAPTLASLYCETCLENLIKKHIVDGLYGGKVSTLWCSYKFELFQVFREYPTLDLLAVYQGELSE